MVWGHGPTAAPPPAPATARAVAAHRVHRLRPARPAGLVGLLAVLGPGLLAGLSDDDPAGITTYSILGAEEGHALLWVIALSTVALIVFHELAARTGVVTVALVLGNSGTLCAELAGIAPGAETLGMSRYVAVPAAAVAVSAQGVAIAVAAIGTTLAPWGLAFMRSYAVDKRLTTGQLRDERIDVVTGAVLAAAVVILVPGVPLVPVLAGTQVLNAVLLLAVLPVMVRLGRDPAVLGEHRLRRGGTVACVAAIAGIAAACALLAATAVP